MSTPADFAENFRIAAATLGSDFQEQLCAGLARDPGLATLLGAAPPTQQNPVLLLNVVHALVLDDPGSELAQYYPTVTGAPRPGDPFPAFAEYCRTHRAAIEALLAVRTTQTNEVGRSGLFLPALGLLATDLGGPLALVDVGTSAGLNLQLDRFAYRYTAADGSRQHVGSPSPVSLTVGTRGPVPVPAAIPAIGGRIGIDQSPVDLADPSARRWLTACVWPDQPERFHRLEAAIGLALEHPPEVVTADAVEGLAEAIDRAGAGGHPVVLNSWVLSYLTPAQRQAYIAELDRIGAERQLSWVYAESPTAAPGLPYPPGDPVDLTMLMLVTWRSGERTVTHLGTCHPHGTWLHWAGRAV